MVPFFLFLFIPLSPFPHSPQQEAPQELTNKKRQKRIFKSYTTDKKNARLTPPYSHQPPPHTPFPYLRNATHRNAPQRQRQHMSASFPPCRPVVNHTKQRQVIPHDPISRHVQHTNTHGALLLPPSLSTSLNVPTLPGAVGCLCDHYLTDSQALRLVTDSPRTADSLCAYFFLCVCLFSFSFDRLCRERRGAAKDQPL